MTEGCSLQDAADQKAARARDAEHERRLRLLATACGFEIISPYGYHPGYIGEPGRAYVLVPHGSGLSLDEIERVLREKATKEEDRA